MSFWGKISGFFSGDDFYPDNPKRLERVKKLADDCQNFADQLFTTGSAFNTVVSHAKMTVFEVFGAAPPPDSQLMDYPLADMTYVISKIFQPIVTNAAISPNMSLAVAHMRLSQGATPQSMSPFLDTPAAGALAGGLSAAFAGFGTSAMFGDIAREKLRALILAILPARETLYRAFMSDRQMVAFIQQNLDSMTSSHHLGVPADDILQHAKIFASQSASWVGFISDSYSLRGLEQIDQSRGSWTNEDK